MNKLLFIPLLLLTSCSALPSLLQTAEDIADDTAVNIAISKEALQREPELEINVKLKRDSR